MPDIRKMCIRDRIIFAGRSNVGKSSIINRVLNRKNFARVGSAPGKTTHINYFLIDKTLYLVDLPGYGFAKVSKAERDRWGNLMESYFAEENLITYGVLVVDIRHRPTQDDITMATWFMDTSMPFCVVANKADKLKKTEIENNLQIIRETLKLPDNIDMITFSAYKGEGREKLLSILGLNK